MITMSSILARGVYTNNYSNLKWESALDGLVLVDLVVAQAPLQRKEHRVSLTWILYK